MARARHIWLGWIFSVALALAAGVGLGILVAPGSVSSHAGASRVVPTTVPAPSTTVPTTSLAQPLQRFVTWVPPTTAPPAAGVLVQGGVPVISRIATTDPVVFFTIDDGWVRDPAVLTFLRDHHVPVTLFVLPAPVHQGLSYFQAIHAM